MAAANKMFAPRHRWHSSPTSVVDDRHSSPQVAKKIRPLLLGVKGNLVNWFGDR